jgi:hypothetical protein
MRMNKFAEGYVQNAIYKLGGTVSNLDEGQKLDANETTNDAH